MLKLAVIGKDISQSLSPQIHKFIFSKLSEKCIYEAISIAPSDFHEQVEELFNRFDAFNVTIPFKKEIIPYLNELRGDAKVFGAVNTVLAKSRVGYNTDGLSFLLMLENVDVKVSGKKVLVLGAGGAGRSVIKKLMEAGANVFVYEHNKARLFEVHDEFGGFTPLEEVGVEKYDIIVNCTGVGMHDSVGKTPSVTYKGGEIAPVGSELISLCDVAVDLIYKPKISAFLEIAKKADKKIINGESMLFYQAYMADCIFLDRIPDFSQAREFYNEFVKKR